MDADAWYDDDPRDVDALHLLGAAAQARGDLPRARALMERSVALRPADGRQQYNLGVVRALLGDPEAAIAAYEAAIEQLPGFAAAHSNVGLLYARAGRPGDALRAYAAAIEAQPDFIAAYANLAALLIERERHADAIAVLEAALRFAPAVPELHFNLGHAYRRSGRRRESLVATHRGLRLRPNFEASLQLSLAAFEAGSFDIALAANIDALALDPDSAAAHCNCSTVYLTTGAYSEAVSACRTAIARAPRYAEAHVNLALALLVNGDFAAGWDEFRWMWRLPARRPSYPYVGVQPVWTGEPFAGRQLLVTREQGFGDAIQMARFLPAVKARGGRVVLETAPELAPLFANLPGVDELRIAPDVGMTWDDVDLHLPLLGLPGALGIDAASIPRPARLHAPAERLQRWRERLVSPQPLRVGIAWSGNPAHVDDRHRSARLEDFAPLGEVAGIAWFGLQKGRDEDRRSCGALVIDPLGPQIRDFSDTAAIVEQLDLVISVDTAVVHLAGTLGRPVWTLLPFAPDWRWLLERADSPWYPTMRLFRQPRAGDWETVIATVCTALALLVKSKSASNHGPLHRHRSTASAVHRR